jgi:cytochrome c2
LKRHVRDPRRDIFMDIDNIPRGVDFVDYLSEQVGQCEVMLAVIGPSWTQLRNASGQARRIDEPTDFVRIEIAAALKRGIAVVPVVLDDTRLPAAEDLPDDLKPLARRNGERLSHESFDADVERLIRNLPRTGPAAEAAVAARRRGGVSPWLAGGAALVVAGGAYGAWLWLVPAATPDVAGEMVASPAEGAAFPTIPDIGARLDMADAARGEAAARVCLSCHSLSEGGQPLTGPPLFGVVGRDIASAPGFDYSPALLALAGAWSAEMLDVWLEHPTKLAPGVKMSFAGFSNEGQGPQDRADVIAYLTTLHAAPASPAPAAPVADRANLERAEAALAVARQQQRRMQALFEAGAASQQSLSDANAQLIAAQADVAEQRRLLGETAPP